MKQDDCGGIARPFVAQMHRAAIGELQPLRRFTAVFRPHLLRIGIGNAEDQEGDSYDCRQDAQNAQRPFHGFISPIQRLTTSSPSSSTVSLPISGMATPGSGLAMR